MTVRLSNSEIQTFKDCRRKWWLTYYRRLQPLYKETTGALALGSRVHEALDMYYSKDIPLLVAHAELVEKDRLLVADQMFVTETLDKEADLGRIMLEGYLQWVEEEGIDMMSNAVIKAVRQLGEKSYEVDIESKLHTGKTVNETLAVNTIMVAIGRDGRPESYGADKAGLNV
jgi:hypothetical protein